MDEIPKNSIDKEKQYFLAKLKRHPIFIMKHLPSLSQILWRRYKNKFAFKAKPHQVGKKKPDWLHCPETLKNHHLKMKPEQWLNLPFYQQPGPIDFLACARNQHDEGVDQEDYLAKHRFIILIENIFNRQLTLPLNVSKWLSKPPPKDDGAWETYSCCERVANFITWATFIPYEKRLSFIPENALAFIAEQMFFIAEHLEYYQKQTGNHILNNARALIMAGTLLKNPAAIEMGLKILEHMLPTLITHEGVLREGSSHYQLIVFKWLLDAYTYAKLSKLCAHDKLHFLSEILVKMQKLAMLFCNQQGTLQIFIGDISPDMSPLLTTQLITHLYPHYWPAPNLTWPTQAYGDWHILSHALHKIVLRAEDQQYPQQIASHKHNDLTSFVWFFEDQAILIDTGRARYTKDKRSSLQKSATGHNSVLVNNLAPLCESLIINGHWYPTPYAKAKVAVNHEHNKLIIKHDGFRRASKVKEHERSIAIINNNLCIEDYFTGKGTVEISLIWQLHPSFQVKSQSSLIFTNPYYQLQIEPDSQPTHIHCLSEDDTYGFHSYQYGVSERHPVVILNWIITLPFNTCLSFKVTACAA